MAQKVSDVSADHEHRAWTVVPSISGDGASGTGSRSHGRGVEQSILGRNTQEVGHPFEGLVIQDEFSEQHLLGDHRAELATDIAE